MTAPKIVENLIRREPWAVVHVVVMSDGKASAQIVAGPGPYVRGDNGASTLPKRAKQASCEATLHLFFAFVSRNAAVWECGA